MLPQAKSVVRASQIHGDGGARREREMLSFFMLTLKTTSLTKWRSTLTNHHSSPSLSPSTTNMATVILGAQWGDEGKGKIVDVIAQNGIQLCCRAQGGHNAGHTIVKGGKKFDVHILRECMTCARGYAITN